MTDKELIEMAAKAAGYKIYQWSDKCVRTDDKDKPWNPLTDDSDALRLASHLNMDIEINEFFVVVYCPFELGCARVELSFEDEKLKSIKKAITMAAAQIGKEIE